MRPLPETLRAAHPRGPWPRRPSIEAERANGETPEERLDAFTLFHESEGHGLTLVAMSRSKARKGSTFLPYMDCNDSPVIELPPEQVLDLVDLGPNVSASCRLCLRLHPRYGRTPLSDLIWNEE